MTEIHKRGSYSTAQKEKVSLEALNVEKTLRQIAVENNISTELVLQWKKPVLEEQNDLLKSLLCKREQEPEWLSKKSMQLGL